MAIRYLKSYSKEYQIEIYEGTINESPMDIGVKIARMNPEVVGFSCYIWNIENTLKVCSVLKEINNNIKIILGGPEVSFDGREILESHIYIDYIIEGEGESSFNKFLKYIVDGSINVEEVEGLVYRDNGTIAKNRPCNKLKDLNVIPFPYDEVPDKIVYYEASRGCPFGCKYCLSSSDRGLRYFDIERVKSELQFFIDREVRLVKFVDRTFNANKNFAREIWEYIIKNNKNTLFHFEIAADILDDETIEFLKGVPKGGFQFEVGVQTTNIKVLENIDRVMNFDLVRKNIISIKEGDNIHCHLDLIVGLPGEDINSFGKSFDECMEIRPEVLQLGFLKILKGSPIYNERERYDIHYIKYPPYQVVSTRDMSFREIDELLKFEKVFETYYNSEIFKVSMEYMLSAISSPFDFFKKFTEYLYEKGFFNFNFDLKGKFKLLLEFSLSNYSFNFIRETLLHDFIINTKKASIPEFFEVEFGGKMRHVIGENISEIEKQLGKIDIKRTLVLPAKIKMHREDDRLKIQEYEGYVIYDLQKGKCFYL